jgi:hypothetical protein
VASEAINFRWDYGEAGNVVHIAAHGMAIDDVLEVYANAPRFFEGNRRARASHMMIGPNLRGRYLQVALDRTFEAKVWYVVTAHWLERRRGQRLYEQ